MHNILILLTSMAKFMALKKNSGFNHRLFCCLLHLTKQPPCFGKFVWKPFILLFSSLENLWIFQTSSNPVWRTWDGRRDSMKTLNISESIKKHSRDFEHVVLCLVPATSSYSSLSSLTLDFSVRPILWKKPLLTTTLDSFQQKVRIIIFSFFHLFSGWCFNLLPGCTMQSRRRCKVGC